MGPVFRTKTQEMSREERKVDGDVQGDSKGLGHIAESNAVFSGRWRMQSFACRYDSEE